MQFTSNKFDQCMHGATREDRPTRKSTCIESNESLPEVERTCDNVHDHLELQGRNTVGPRTAQAAVFPDGLCFKILDAAARLGKSRTGGSVSIKMDDTLKSMAPTAAIGTLLSELYSLAIKRRLKEAWQRIVAPWLNAHIAVVHDAPFHFVTCHDNETMGATVGSTAALTASGEAEAEPGAVSKHGSSTTTATDWKLQAAGVTLR